MIFNFAYGILCLIFLICLIFKCVFPYISSKSLGELFTSDLHDLYQAIHTYIQLIPLEKKVMVVKLMVGYGHLEVSFNKRIFKNSVFLKLN